MREIESILEKHPDVAVAITVLEGNADADSRLHVYVLPRGNRRPTPSELRALIRQRGLEHLVPASFSLVESLPLLPSGKVNRRALANQAARLPEPQIDSPAVPPGTRMEQAIASIWCSVLNIDSPGVHENFFDLGGHSLSMMRVHRQLREELGVNISIIELFRYPTVSALAAVLERPVAAAGGHSA